MKTIALDAGHYLYTAGKEITLAGYEKTKEWYLNDRINDILEELLVDYECKVIRVGDTTGKKDISLEQRVKTANDAGAIVYVSTHHDSGVGGGAGGGTTVFYFSSSSARKAQAERLYKCVVAKTELVGNRYSKVQKKGFFVLKKTKMPAFLIENGFMDSTTDVPIILSLDHAEKTAQGILDFLVKEYSLEKKKPTEGENKDLYAVEEIVSYLNKVGIISDVDLWLTKLKEDKNAYWLAKKTADYIKSH